MVRAALVYLDWKLSLIQGSGADEGLKIPASFGISRLLTKENSPSSSTLVYEAVQ